MGDWRGRNDHVGLGVVGGGKVLLGKVVLRLPSLTSLTLTFRVRILFAFCSNVLFGGVRVRLRKSNGKKRKIFCQLAFEEVGGETEQQNANERRCNF